MDPASAPMMAVPPQDTALYPQDDRPSYQPNQAPTQESMYPNLDPGDFQPSSLGFAAQNEAFAPQTGGFAPQPGSFGQPQAVYSQGQPCLPRGMPRQGPPPQGYPPQGHPQQGYPPQGYPPQGYPPQGYPLQGYQQNGQLTQSGTDYGDLAISGGLGALAGVAGTMLSDGRQATMGELAIGAGLGGAIGVGGGMMKNSLKRSNSFSGQHQPGALEGMFGAMGVTDQRTMKKVATYGTPLMAMSAGFLANKATNRTEWGGGQRRYGGGYSGYDSE